MTATVAQLRKLLELATPGPWEVCDALDRKARVYRVAFSEHRQANDGIVAEFGRFPDTMAPADARLVVELVNAAPALLDELEAFRAITADLQRAER